MARVRKLLVANRGEIAVRIFRACRELGIVPVAVYSEADRDALHVRLADEAYLLGEAAPAASYLNARRILEAARRARADAVHPGYGFLAENPAFARAVASAGFVWVGPPAEAVEAMGDKTAARRTAASVGVESVPGTPERVAGPQAVLEFAGRHGWPVAIKAAHGGGGRGFRVVASPEEAAAAYEGAAREAELSFGSADLYLERYLDEPRHVEVQVIGDTRGNLVHLGERDCTLQRRHQKLVEESPSPAVDAGLRERMGEAAVRVARAAGYQSAGTVEFLLEETPDGPRFWFLEVNTRLQVEHPVTEEVTGIDLAQEMIRVAEGDRLSFSQGDVALRGHAIECRINSEDAAHHFMPTPGSITEYREPGGPGVRVDSGFAAGSTIPQAYDSLIAKLVCKGRTREEAIARTLRALDEFVIGGIPTTIPFHRLVVSSDWFRAGRCSTKTVERDLDLSVLRRGAVLEASLAPSRVVTVQLRGKRFEVRFSERTEVEAARRKPRPPDMVRRAAAAGADETITAPMQGTIVKVLRQVGEEVRAGEGIVVLEAMKMENLITCQREGVVREMRVKAGDAVRLGAPLAVIGHVPGGAGEP